VFQYALVDTTGKRSLADLRSYQDWYLQYYLKSVPGVAEVAPLGGFVRQYQVNVDPNKLQSFNIPINKVVDAVRTGKRNLPGRKRAAKTKAKGEIAQSSGRENSHFLWTIQRGKVIHNAQPSEKAR